MFRIISRRSLVASGVLTLSLFWGAATRAAVIVNGSFESPALAPGAFVNFAAGGEPVGFAWKVGTGNVDLGYLPVSPFVQFSAYDGNQGVDLNGNNRGSIFQDFMTVIGQKYELTFAYADNPNEGGVSSADVKVVDLGSSSTLLNASISHSTSSNGPPPSADYTLFSAFFTATGTSTRLSFESTSASNSASGGIILDAVDVSPAANGEVPEPASIAVWLTLMTVGAVVARRKSAGRPEQS